MLRITKQTDYGLIALTQLASAPQAVRSAAELAAAGSLPAPMVSKVLKVLARAGLVASVRGVAGGYRLARDPAGLSVAEIVTALEGPIAITECIATVEGCQHQALCPTHNHWQWINGAIQGALGQVSLADLLSPASGGVRGPGAWLPDQDLPIAATTAEARSLPPLPART